MTQLPKISVISPSKNCERFVRRCIDGVLAQGYPNIEHIIADGASTDTTVSILQQYPHLRWTSEPDSGEAQALNRALAQCTGEIVTWLNVDDYYVNNDVFRLVAKEFALHPECDVLYGRGVAVNEEGEVAWCRMPVHPLDLVSLMNWTVDLNIIQPAMFFRKYVLDDVGPFREDLKYAIDNDYWLRVAAKGYRYHFVNQPLAFATLVRGGAKSSGSVEEQHMAWHQVTRAYEDMLIPEMRISYWRDYYRFRIRNPAGYTSPISVPEARFELIGFTIAALETGYMEAAVLGVEKLTAQYPGEADGFWLLSEVLNKQGHHQHSRDAAIHATALVSREVNQVIQESRELSSKPY